MGLSSQWSAGYRRPGTSFSLWLSGMACTAAGRVLRETQPAQVTRHPLPMGTACSPCFQGLTSLLLSSREGMKGFLNQRKEGHVNVTHSLFLWKAREPHPSPSALCDKGRGLFWHCLAEAPVGPPHRLIAQVTNIGLRFCWQNSVMPAAARTTSMTGKGRF